MMMYCSLIVESVVTELSSVIKDKDKEQKILNAKELLFVVNKCSM